MKLRRGDLLLYTMNNPGRGSVAIALTDEYEDASCTTTKLGVDVDWISVHPWLTKEHDMGYNVSCFEKIGHIEIIENNS